MNLDDFAFLLRRRAAAQRRLARALRKGDHERAVKIAALLEQLQVDIDRGLAEACKEEDSAKE